MASIVAQRTAYWKQRGKVRALREGDANTRYFHAKTSGRARRNAIRVLEVNGQSLVAHGDKVTALTTYSFDILGGSATTSWLYEGGRSARCTVRNNNIKLLVGQ